MKRRIRYCSLLLPALWLSACAAPFWSGARDFIVVADIAQVPESDPFALREARIEGDSLKFLADYRGGCRNHTFTLYVSRSAPGTDTALLYVQHDADHDVCDGRVEGDVVAFSLRGLKVDLRLLGTSVLSYAPAQGGGFALTY